MSAKKLDRKQSEDALLAYIRSTNPHVFGNGSWKDNWTNGNGLGSALGMVGAAGSIGASAISMANPDTASVEEKVDAQLESIKGQRNIGQFESLDDLMAGWASNRNLSTSFDADDYYNGPSTGDIITGTLSSTVSGATAGMAAGPWGALAGAVVGLGAGLIGGLTGRSKAKDAANDAAGKLANEARKTNNYRQQAYQTMAQNMVAKNNRNLFSQIAAYGGPLGISLLPVGGAIDYMQNEELLASLGENMTKNNNERASMPKFAFGGALGGYGGDWSNGLNFIKAGGTHGENPIGGVPMGIAQDGMPNLVEEGEVVWNDYVFSNRINVPNAVREKLGIKGKDTMTFAEAVEKAQKNSAERPNDPIETRGLESVLTSLMQEQEVLRRDKAEKDQFNSMEEAAAFAADGGSIHIAKNKRGTFTAAATKHGMGVQEFASHVLANKDKYSSTMVKKANFAKNAAKWHALGGYLFDGGGSLYPNTSLFAQDYSFGQNWKPLDAVLFDPNWRPSSTLDFNMNGLQPPTRKQFQMTTEPAKSTPQTQKQPMAWESFLRYAPVLGSAIGLGYTLFNQPDYEYANELETAANQYVSNVSKVSPTLLGDYLAYNPFDRLFYANELGAQAAATRSAIMNQSNSNAGQAMAGLLAADYNSTIGLGKLFREGEEYNLAQRQKVAEFNRATNMYNSEADLKAQMANAELDKAKASLLLDAKMKALGLKQSEDQAWDAALAANLTGLFDNIGNIGWEAVNRNMINDNDALYYGMTRSGRSPYKGGYAKDGGYLTIKNRRKR